MNQNGDIALLDSIKIEYASDPAECEAQAQSTIGTTEAPIGPELSVSSGSSGSIVPLTNTGSSSSHASKSPGTITSGSSAAVSSRFRTAGDFSATKRAGSSKSAVETAAVEENGVRRAVVNVGGLLFIFPFYCVPMF